MILARLVAIAFLAAMGTACAPSTQAPPVAGGVDDKPKHGGQFNVRIPVGFYEFVEISYTRIYRDGA